MVTLIYRSKSLRHFIVQTHFKIIIFSIVKQPHILNRCSALSTVCHELISWHTKMNSMRQQHIHFYSIFKSFKWRKQTKKKKFFICTHERKAEGVETKESCVSPSLNSFFASAAAAAAATLRFLATSIPFGLHVFECAVQWVCSCVCVCMPENCMEMLAQPTN